MSILTRCNVTRMGDTGKTIVFGHGLGTDQQVWRLVAPDFAKDHRVTLFDHAGCGKAERRAYDPETYDTLARYAEDLLEVCRAVNKGKVIFVGHSVSAMIGVHALLQDPEAFSLFVMVAPSPCYMNLPGYHGGMEREAVDAALKTLHDDQRAWSQFMGQALIGADNSPKLIEAMVQRLASNDPTMLRQFAKVTLTSDCRALLKGVRVPTCIMQLQRDVICPREVGDFVHGNIPASTLVQLPVTGHCPQLVAPSITIDVIRSYLDAHHQGSSARL